MKQAIRTLSLLSLLAFLFMANITVAQNIHKDCFDGTVYLKIKETAGIQLPILKSAADRAGYPYFNYLLDVYGVHEIDRPFKNIRSSVFENTYQVRFDQPEKVEALIAALNARPEVEYVERVPIMRSFYTPNDDYANNSQQWFLSKIKAYQAWDIHKNGSDVVLAIVDDAVRWDHEDLEDNLWINQAEANGWDNWDDDGNGYIDDIIGWDAANFDNNPIPPSFASNFNFSHGTHCAGIAAGVTNNNEGIASISFNNAKIMACKGQLDFGNGNGIEYAWEAFAYAAANKADIISCSWGNSFFSQTHQNLVNWAANNGSIVVAAAGNDNTSTPMYPAAYNNVIAVANTTQNDTRNQSSNYGSWVDIAAPGTAILSPVATTYGSYQVYDGTSMACPLVAGLLAQMKSFKPNASNSQIVACLYSSADNINGQNPGYQGLLGAGRINAQAALQCLGGGGGGGGGIGCSPPNGFKAHQIGYAHVWLDWDDLAAAEQYQTRQRKAGSSSWNEGNWYTNSTTIWGNMTPCTEYEFQVRSKCNGQEGNFSSSIFVTTTGCNDDYCYSYGITWDDWIERVQFGSINNQTGKDYGFGYYTNLSTNVQTGDSYTIQLTAKTDDDSETAYWRVWIDFNHDGDFEDSNEKVLQKTGSNNQTISGTITIPSNVQTGVARMRISMDINAYADPCKTGGYREVEDYTINILGQSPTISISPTSKTVGATETSASFNVSSNTAWDIDNVSANWVNTSKNGNTVTLTFGENTSTSGRTAQVIVKTTTGNLSKTFALTQEGAVGGAAFLDVSTEQITVGPNQQTAIFGLYANTSWVINVVTNSPWLGTINPFLGNNDKTVYVPIEANNSAQQRVALLEITAIGTAARTVTIIQQGALVNAIGDEAERLSVTAFPNPAKDWLHLSIETESTAPVQVQLSDVTGRIVQTWNGQNILSGQPLELDVSHLPKGLYFARIEQDGRVTTERIFVSR